MLKCEMCGKEVKPGRRAKYCLYCYTVAVKERNKSYHEQRKAEASVRKCVICGREYRSERKEQQVCFGGCGVRLAKINGQGGGKCRKDDCKYKGKTSGLVTCDYRLIMGHGRGCAADQCDKYTKERNCDKFSGERHG